MASHSLTPRWYSMLQTALSKAPQNTIYSFSTVKRTDRQDSASTVPKVRYVVNRSFILPSQSLPLLVFTTDIRSEKVDQITSHPEGIPNSEIVWWFEGSGEQYRISGHVHVLGHPSHPLTKSFPAQRLSPPIPGFDWESERIRTFDEKMGGALRATFARPIPPGTEMKSYDDAKDWPTKIPKSNEPSNEREAQQIKFALENFSLMVIEPVELNVVELSVVPNRKTRFTRVNEEAGNGWIWKEIILCP